LPCGDPEYNNIAQVTLNFQNLTTASVDPNAKVLDNGKLRFTVHANRTAGADDTLEIAYRITRQSYDENGLISNSGIEDAAGDTFPLEGVLEITSGNTDGTIDIQPPNDVPLDVFTLELLPSSESPNYAVDYSQHQAIGCAIVQDIEATATSATDTVAEAPSKPAIGSAEYNRQLGVTIDEINVALPSSGLFGLGGPKYLGKIIVDRGIASEYDQAQVLFAELQSAGTPFSTIDLRDSLAIVANGSSTHGTIVVTGKNVSWEYQNGTTLFLGTIDDRNRVTLRPELRYLVDGSTRLGTASLKQLQNVAANAWRYYGDKTILQPLQFIQYSLASGYAQGSSYGNGGRTTIGENAWNSLSTTFGNGEAFDSATGWVVGAADTALETLRSVAVTIKGILTLDPKNAQQTIRHLRLSDLVNQPLFGHQGDFRTGYTLGTYTEKAVEWVAAAGALSKLAAAAPDIYAGIGQFLNNGIRTGALAAPTTGGAMLTLPGVAIAPEVIAGGVTAVSGGIVVTTAASAGAFQPIIVNMTSLPEGPGGSYAPKGKLTVDPAGTYSASERAAAQHMADLGHDVTLRPPTGTRAAGGTSDLLVDGVRYDVYTPTTGNPNRIISAIAKKNTQAEGVVLDLSQSSVTQAQLGDALKRVQGAGATNIKNIIIIGGK
jgi:hypothetical protein